MIWRGTSFGGFAERMLTVVSTLRKQGRNVLSFLESVCRAAIDGSTAPSLLHLASPSG